MKNDVYRRAHETDEHVCIKQALANLLRSCGWIVLVESLCVDLTAFKPERGAIWILEVERSEKNIRQNILKAFMRGGHRLLVVASSRTVAVNAQKIIDIQREDIRARTLVVTPVEVNEEFVRRVMER